VQGREVPPPGRWAIDPVHSSLQFTVRHLMIATVRGRFRELSGTIVIGDEPRASWCEAAIRADSIDTGDAQRDEHLRSAEFLDVGRFPELRFVSTSVQPRRDERWEVAGDLTIRDVTRAVVLDVEYLGVAVDPWGNARAGLHADTRVDRDEFGVSWNQALEAGGFLVGKDVRIEIDVEAVLQGENGMSEAAVVVKHCRRVAVSVCC
jgi:polyisoprenoid-binding protein YceI